MTEYMIYKYINEKFIDFNGNFYYTRPKFKYSHYVILVTMSIRVKSFDNNSIVINEEVDSCLNTFKRMYPEIITELELRNINLTAKNGITINGELFAEIKIEGSKQKLTNFLNKYGHFLWERKFFLSRATRYHPLEIFYVDDEHKQRLISEFCPHLTDISWNTMLAMHEIVNGPYSYDFANNRAFFRDVEDCVMAKMIASY